MIEYRTKKIFNNGARDHLASRHTNAYDAKQ